MGPLDFEPAEIEIFYGLLEEYWGKGIATEAAMAMLYYGFKVIGLKKIVAVTDYQNIRSLKVIEKLKMPFIKKVVGLPEEHSHYEDNSYSSITRKEFLKSCGDGFGHGIEYDP